MQLFQIWYAVLLLFCPSSLSHIMADAYVMQATSKTEIDLGIQLAPLAWASRLFPYRNTQMRIQVNANCRLRFSIRSTIASNNFATSKGLISFLLDDFYAWRCKPAISINAGPKAAVMTLTVPNDMEAPSQ